MRTEQLQDFKYRLSAGSWTSDVRTIGYEDVRRYFEAAARVGFAMHARLDDTSLTAPIRTWKEFEIHLAHGNTITANGWNVRVIGKD